MLTRRDAIRAGTATVAALGLAPAFWRTGRAAASVGAPPASGPYGPLQPPDVHGIRLPKGFRSRLIAHGGVPVLGTDYPWHIFSDGAATFATPDGGWILVSNSEIPVEGAGGASAIRFSADGTIVDAYRILSGSHTNCAGGATPWGTWLSCEEIDHGLVWECDPTGSSTAVARPAMGRFNHEAAAVDPRGQAVYLTEDERDGGLYRFTPRSYPDLSRGRLDVAVVRDDGRVRWVEVPDPQGAERPTRKQVEDMTRFQRGEGIWYDAGFVYVATTADSKVHAYDTHAGRLTTVYDKAAHPDPPLINPDNLTVSVSGDIFVGEDTGGQEDPLDLGIITPEGEVARFLKLTGPQHGLATDDTMSEVTGPVFDPSGTRLYFASQRAYFNGQIYEITGPFRRGRAAGAPARRVRERPPAPAIGIELPRRQALRGLMRAGLPVAVTLDRPARITIVARAAFGRRGRRRTVTLGRESRELAAGFELLHLPLHRRGRERVGDRRRLRMVVDVTLDDGETRETLRRVVRVRRG